MQSHIGEPRLDVALLPHGRHANCPKRLLNVFSGHCKQSELLTARGLFPYMPGGHGLGLDDPSGQ